MATLTKSRRKTKAALYGQTARRMTVREFLALPDDEGFESSLIYGEMVIMPRPTPKHNDLLHHLGELPSRWIRFMKLGKLFFDNDLILSEKEALVLAPDLMFLSTENLDHYHDEHVYGPVDLAIEIVSPSERPYLRDRKFADYESHGIEWYWIIDPTGDEPTLREYQLVSGKYKCRAEVMVDEWFEPGVFRDSCFACRRYSKATSRRP